MLSILVPLLVAACSPDGDETAAPDDSAADDTASAACNARTSGRWTADGACFGMPMKVDLAWDQGFCTFTLDNWDMEMGPMPTGGTLDGSSVTLAGSGSWPTCTGTATGDSLAGTCEGGCGWSLAGPA